MPQKPPFTIFFGGGSFFFCGHDSDEAKTRSKTSRPADLRSHLSRLCKQDRTYDSHFGEQGPKPAEPIGLQRPSPGCQTKVSAVTCFLFNFLWFLGILNLIVTRIVILCKTHERSYFAETMAMWMTGATSLFCGFWKSGCG